MPTDGLEVPAGRGATDSQQQQQQHQQQLTATSQHRHQHHTHHHQDQQQQQQLIEDLAKAAARRLPVEDVSRVLRAAAAAVASQQVLPGLLRLLLDEVVCAMADHVPLLDIVGRVIQQHGSERFGEFRSTLLGLFGATRYDSAIMAAANRLITGDAFAAVRHAYGLRQLARALQEQQQQQEQVEELPHVGGSSRGVLVPPPAAAATVGGVPIPGGAVQSAMLLGVLGPSSYEASSGSSSGSRYSLTQAERDLIQGILGSGGMRLQLQPAGLTAGQLPGVAAEYRAAAQAVSDTGRMFRGEMDLALELAMLQSLQEHQQHQQRQQDRGEPAPGKEWGLAWHGHGATAGTTVVQHGQAASPGAVTAARATASTSSFDIDELLTWSHTHM